MEIALTEKKILIIEEYLRNPKDKTTAVKTIDPSIKNPSAYAWKLFNEIEVKEYLVKRRLELLKESSITPEELVKGVSIGLKQSLGLEKRKVYSFGKEGLIYSNEDIHPDSIDAKNYYSILERVLGSEISGVLAQKEIQEEHKRLLKDKESTIKTTFGKETIKLKNEKLEKELGKGKDKEENGDVLIG
ncbi:MAG: hypothetical protein RR523_01715 [Cetobacterium sp.]|uniref:hypothetical protein n=1 Tax=Cetobacterium sp. TaxID=2071632 RepID=UPI002FC631E9